MRFRRSKAAEIAELDKIVAEVFDENMVSQGVQEIPINSLLSPKDKIDLSGSGLDRWMDTLGKTLRGSQPPNIFVRPGTNGTPISNVPVGF